MRQVGPRLCYRLNQEVILEWQLTSSEIKRPFALLMVGNDGRAIRVSKVVFPQ